MNTPRKLPPRKERGFLGPVVAAILVVALVLSSLWGIPAILTQFRSAAVATTGTTWRVPGNPSPLPGVLDTTGSQPPSEERVDAIQKILDTQLDAAPGTVSASVLDAQTGGVLAHKAADHPHIPASNQKILTALTIAENLNPYSRFATTVEAMGAGGDLTLVAGGDTLLAPGQGTPEAVNGHAGLGDLAQITADSLVAGDVRGDVTVGVNTELFTGAALNPAWSAEDVALGEITDVSPIALYSHRVAGTGGTSPGAAAPRPDDAAQAVLEEFCRQLSERTPDGLDVTVGTQDAPTGGTEIARVESATVAEQAAYMLHHSDNSLAETLARLAARAAGQPGSIAGAQRATRAALDAQSIPAAHTRIVDASGMAIDNRVSASTMAQATRALATDPRYGPYAQGLPLGGASGTLQNRFDHLGHREVRGLTRAKTGTLNSVVTLSGYVQDSDDTLMVYSILVNDVPGQIPVAREAVDGAVAALAGD